MKILAVVFPGFTALDLVGPANAWGLMPGVEFQTAWKTAGPVTVDMGLQLVATHSLADCWRARHFRTTNCSIRSRRLARARAG
jgi:cyclohexyl-isocyanide hydratase